MTVDLLLKGGHLIDPAAGRDGRFDVAFAGGKFAAVAPSIDAMAKDVMDAAGYLVVPGLIDLHTHVYRGATRLGVDADRLARSAGTTTAVDAGSAGADTIAGLFDLVRPVTASRLLAFVNLSSAGIFSDAVGEAEDLRLLDIEACARAALARPGDIVGVKIRIGASTSGRLGAMPLHMAIRAAERAGDLPVMVHIGAGLPPRLEDIVEPLRPGDILTHCCTPRMNAPVSRDGKVRDCILAARRRGVILDVGHGSNSFGFGVARAMIAAGLAPDVISSDVHADCIDGPAFDVLTTMSKFLALGLPLADVVRAATAAPAAAIRRPELGTLAPGAVGDAVVLKMSEEPVAFIDCLGETLTGEKRLAVASVVLGGKQWHSAGVDR